MGDDIALVIPRARPPLVQSPESKSASTRNFSFCQMMPDIDRTTGQVSSGVFLSVRYGGTDEPRIRYRPTRTRNHESWNGNLAWMLVWALMFAGSAWAGDALANREAKPFTTQQSSVPPGILDPPLPTNMSLPTYDYAVAESCAGCHFLLGLDHTSRVLGVLWNEQTQTWNLTGSGWLASAHSQTDHGSTENTFCAKCHSPLQGAATASFNNGIPANANPVPQARFQAVTCTSCHPPNNVAAQLAALNPNAIDGGGIAIYLWKGFNNPASYQTVSPGQEDQLCLHCHEQRHNTDDTAFAAMYAAGVRCEDCHMAPYQYLGGGTTGLPQLAERFHDWKVGTNLPYSCGAQGSLSGFGCHSSFSVTDAQNIIPFIRQQHMKWWSLPPFNNQPQVALSAHGTMTVAEYRVFWRELAETNSGATR